MWVQIQDHLHLTHQPPHPLPVLLLLPPGPPPPPPPAMRATKNRVQVARLVHVAPSSMRRWEPPSMMQCKLAISAGERRNRRRMRSGGDGVPSMEPVERGGAGI